MTPTTSLGPTVLTAGDEEVLLPYVSRLALGWVPVGPEDRLRVIEGTLAFIDVSGFTRLTELLAARGKAGAEELTGLLDEIFADLLALAYRYSGELVKWGGDAVLVLFSGPSHAERAVAATWKMQKKMSQIGRLRTSVGPCRLAISVGIHSGAFHFFMVGERHRELVVTGPASSATAVMEAVAEAGEIVVSPATAAQLGPDVVGQPKGTGYLVAAAPPTERLAFSPVDGGQGGQPYGYLPERTRDYLLAGPVESEHRQVAVGFVEFGGTDGLLAAGASGDVASALHELMGRAQDSCARHEVTFWETDIAEDGGKLMLVAGAPSASGDDAGRLLAVVRDVVDVGGLLRLRAGANYGRVFAGNFGPAYRRTYSVKGDAVNLAARLMAKAGRGEICVSDVVLRRSRTLFRSEELEPFQVKGKSAPVLAHRLGRASAGRHSSGRGVPAPAAAPDAVASMPLLGREKELAFLEERLRSARRGQGACAQLEGPPGIGKSRLIEEILSRATDFDLFSIVCDEYQSSVPYAPLRDLGRQCLGIDADSGPGPAGAALTEVVAERAPGLLPWLPLLAGVVGADVSPTREAGALDERFRRPRLEETFIELLRALLPAPTLMVVDDVHYMDDASVDLVRRLVGSLGSLPWFLVTSRCPQPGGLFFDGASGVARLELGPLTDEVISQLLQSASGARPLAPHRGEAVAARSGGNPLFLLELVANDLGTGAEAPLPDTIEGVLAAQIDRLLPPERRLLRAASVLGMQVPVPVLAEMVGEPLTGAELGGLGEFLAGEGPGEMRFRHSTLREAAYEGLSYSRRRELHAKAGQVLENQAGEGAPEIAALLAVHFGHAGQHQAAWRYARMAAERAWGVYASAEAATFFEQALAAGRSLREVPASELVAVAESLGDARSRLGEFSSAENTYRLARRWATTPLQRARLHYKVALTADRAGQYPTALRMLSVAQRSLGDARDNISARLRAEIQVHYGRVRQRQGRSREAVRLLQEATALARSAEARDVEAQALLILDQAELTVGSGDGERARAALQILRDVGGQLWLEGRALNEIGIRAYFAGRWSEAAKCYADARSAWQKAGDQWTAAMTAGNIAEILSDQGRLAEAEDILTETMRTFRAARTPSFIAYAALLLGRVAARRGQYERARASLEEAQDLFEADGEALEVVHARAVLAESHLLAGDVEAARSLASETLSDAAKLAGRDLVLPLLLRVLAVAEVSARGDRALARQHLERSIDVARTREHPYELALSLQAMASLWPEALTDGLTATKDALLEQLGVLPAARSALSLVGQSPISHRT